MAAATVNLLVHTGTFRLPGVDANLSIPDTGHDQKIEGDHDLEMMMLDGSVSQHKFFHFVFSFNCIPFVHQELAGPPSQMDTRGCAIQSCRPAENN
jgi:hypothetical protein